MATGGEKNAHIHNVGMCELPMCDKFGKDAVGLELASGGPKTKASRFDATNCRKVSVEGSLRLAFDFTKQANQRRRHANVRNSE